MSLALNMTKQSAGEHFIIEVRQFDQAENRNLTIDEMRQLFKVGLELADERTFEMNMRILETSGLKQYCDPVLWQKISMVIDIIAGNLSADRVADLWKAEREETADLEMLRQQAYVVGHIHDPITE